MLQLIAALSIGAVAAVALWSRGRTRLAKIVGLVLGGVLVFFASLVVFGLLFND